MRRLAILLAVVVVNLGAIAGAHDHRAPRSTLRVGNEVQRGHLYHADGWSRPDKDPRFCVVSFASGFPTFPKPVRYSTGGDLVVRLHKAAPPLEIEVQQWPEVDADGNASGTPTPMPWILRPHGEGEVRAWEIVIPALSVGDHMYLGVGASWADEHDCSTQPDLGSQSAAWTFHLVEE